MAGLTALIPLDGTPLAEQALSAMPLLKSLGFDQIRLVSVGEIAWQEPSGTVSKELSESIERSRSLYDSYLKERVARVEAFGFKASHASRVGRAAEEILDEAEKVNADLIAIATHGRSGVARVRLGSVADQVVRRAEIPTLVFGPNVEVKLDPFEIRRVLVPLDGSQTGEQALPLARYVAERVGAGLDLVRVVSIPTMSIEPAGGYSVDLVEAMQESARIYLERMANELETSASVRTFAIMGSVADDLLQYMQENAIDLVVMTSHGRGGVVRWLLGSIADRMLHGPAPVLIVRPGQESRLLDEARKR